jgi:predicted TIM-barrel fold metal-dependent hydrolase
MILDVNCFVGHWPSRRLPYRTAVDVRQLMARTNTQGTLITPLAALLYKDCLSAVREMLDELELGAFATMWPVAVVNPIFPGWRNDLDIMVEEWECVALRLFPNYHGYRLPDTETEKLLAQVQDRQLPLMISVRIEDERLQHRLMRVEPVSHFDISWVLRMFPGVKLVLCGLRPDEVDLLSGDILTHPSAGVDISERMPQFYLEEMVKQLGSNRILLGTGMPLKYPECALQQVNDAQLSRDIKHDILFGNAHKLLGMQLDPVRKDDN